MEKLQEIYANLKDTSKSSFWEVGSLMEEFNLKLYSAQWTINWHDSDEHDFYEIPLIKWQGYQGDYGLFMLTLFDTPVALFKQHYRKDDVKYYWDSSNAYNTCQNYIRTKLNNRRFLEGNRLLTDATFVALVKNAMSDSEMSQYFNNLKEN